jgi:hypothetical protein
MNYYFLPKIFPLSTTLTLTNYSPVSKPHYEPENQFVYVTYSTGEVWKLFFFQEIAPGKTAYIESKDLPSDIPEGASVFIFMYPKRLPDTLEKLLSDPIMETDPNWRGNIQFRSHTTAVSYQSEYPGSMLNIPKGTLLIFNPLIQTQEEINTLVLSINITSKPEIKTGTYFISKLVSGEVVKTGSMKTNTINIADMEGLTNSVEDPLCFYSRDMVALPIFFSHDPSFRFLSFEHSYPMNEFCIFGDSKFPRITEIRQHWMNSLSYE